MSSTSLLPNRRFNNLYVNRLQANNILYDKENIIEDDSKQMTFKNLSQSISEKYLDILKGVEFHTEDSKYKTTFEEMCDPTGTSTNSTGSGIFIAHNATNDTTLAGGIVDSEGNTYYASFWSSSLFKFNKEGVLVDCTITSVITEIPNTALIGFAGLPSVYPPGDKIRALAALDDFTIVGNYLYCSCLFHVWDDPRTNIYMQTGNGGNQVNASPKTKKYDIRTPYLYDGAYIQFGQVYRYDLNKPLAGQTPKAMIPIKDCRNAINGITSEGTYVYASTADGSGVENLSAEQVYDYNISIGIPANKAPLTPTQLAEKYVPGRAYKIDTVTETVTVADFTFEHTGRTDSYKDKSCYSNGWAAKDGYIYTVITDAGHIVPTPGIWNASTICLLCRISTDFTNKKIEILNDDQTIMSYSLGTRISGNTGVTIIETTTGGTLYSFTVPDSTEINPTVQLYPEVIMENQEWLKNTGYNYSTEGYTNPPVFNYIPVISGGKLPSEGNNFSYTNNGFNFKDRTIPCFIDQLFFDNNGVLNWCGNISYVGKFLNLSFY